MYTEEIAEQNRTKDRILQNWIASQILAQDLPEFNPMSTQGPHKG